MAKKGGTGFAQISNLPRLREQLRNEVRDNGTASAAVVLISRSGGRGNNQQRQPVSQRS